MPKEAQEVIERRINTALQVLIGGAVLRNERVARELGLNVVDLQTFGLIARHDGPMSPGEVVRAAGLPGSTVTRVIDRLVDAGFVRRTPSETDRRRVEIAAIAERVPEVVSHYEGITAQMREFNQRFDGDELAIVARYLEAIAEAT
ncbi:MAG TPA: MarR family transcriptional regulator [Gordonia polyisoprenivorans]|uniref:MarR family transcriptional regulator n=1 Tax=Gordonia polyisoprenivorans TaxID=84595 RepID=A0A846WG29_9ACTN|nr:MarR family transcriptional regulator [Gordonia polyisoprenivorans]MBE7192074.1 MarR family transcriptional regulator [Gordonia polyisoprenivorans]NKY00016.1 MarR family transcriptional regulator [Gordonia polyisoprenivorans]OZC33703.1 MarR family transcriptional regulator [Gordonia polyisoprenivorans]UZF57142.1 MarR family transcriptional regulator [Gordonia polyisoprenivorans]WCB38204.1 MarR family transcriptional regulator [Gordonia polyisoprenivorans]